MAYHPIMSDIEKSFTFLQTGIPQWLQDINRIQDKVTAMQDETTKVSVSQSPFVERDTSAVDLLRADKLDAVAEDATPPNETPTSLMESRKRKPLSVRSDGASGPSRYRPRIMVVVEYDGDMQKSFELIVRAIGTARSMLRKAKMEAKMNELAAVVGSSEDEDEVDDDDDDDDDDDNDNNNDNNSNNSNNNKAFVSESSYRPRITLMRMQAAAKSCNSRRGGGGSSTPIAIFDTIDKTLEQAQSLCEKAAHLTLREGDCRKELDGVQKYFEQILEMAKTEVTKCNASKSRDVPELSSQDTSDTSVSSMEQPSHKKRSKQVSEETLESTPQPKTAFSPAPTETAPTVIKGMDITVDDNDSEKETDFIMPPVRFMSRRAGRT